MFRTGWDNGQRIVIVHTGQEVLDRLDGTRQYEARKGLDLTGQDERDQEGTGQEGTDDSGKRV